MLLELTSSHNGDQVENTLFDSHLFYQINFVLLAFFHYKLILTCLLFVENSKYFH